MAGAGGSRLPSTETAAAPSDPVFVYGHDLGGSGRWKALEADEYGYLALDWFGYEDDEEDNVELAMGERMLTVLGCPEPWDTPAYWACVLAAPSRLGVGILRHGSADEPQYALATAVVPIPRAGRQRPRRCAGPPTTDG